MLLRKEAYMNLYYKIITITLDYYVSVLLFMMYFNRAAICVLKKI